MTIKLIASEKNWIESSAVEQLKQVANLPGMQTAVGMPDLHPGKGAPVGAVFACEKMIYPHLVGSDVGCGMALWQTDLRKGRVKLGKLAERLETMPLKTIPEKHVELSMGDPTGDWTAEFDRSLGTIGGGNHFAELQSVAEVFDQNFFESKNIDPQSIFLLVHSGSRGLGQQIYREHCQTHGGLGLAEGSDEAHDYMTKHDQALDWATRNRLAIAERFCRTLDMQAEQLLDISHNLVEAAQSRGKSCWLHRKGAAPSDRGPVVIPGSRGTLSYLVLARGDQEENLFTVAHGAGRKWTRSDCRGRLEKRFSWRDLRRTTLGGYVICTDRDLLYEEAPQAYKDIDIVVQDLVEAGIVRLLASMTPLITFKTTKDRS